MIIALKRVEKENKEWLVSLPNFLSSVAEDWIAVLLGYYQFKTEAGRVALRYKLPVQIALMKQQMRCDYLKHQYRLYWVLF